MKSFRERLRLIPEDERVVEPLLRPAEAKRHETRFDDLTSISIPRNESRWANMREDERHRLKAEEAVITTIDEDRVIVELLNLSAGGAMIGTDYVPEFLEPIQLDLGDGGEIEAAVRWVKDERIGLEFAKETMFSCDAATRDAVLLDTIRRSFPEAAVDGVADSGAPSEAASANRTADDSEAGDGRQPRSARRHPLIWSGDVHYDHDTHPVRLRNISETGALIETPICLPQDAGLLLDLREAGVVFSHVSWCRGGQAGLRFEEKFNVAKLSAAQPDLTSDWESPATLKKRDNPDKTVNAARAGSEWADHWAEPSLDELRQDLEGRLKH